MDALSEKERSDEDLLGSILSVCGAAVGTSSTAHASSLCWQTNFSLHDQSFNSSKDDVRRCCLLEVASRRMRNGETGEHVALGLEPTEALCLIGHIRHSSLDLPRSILDGQWDSFPYLWTPKHTHLHCAFIMLMSFSHSAIKSSHSIPSVTLI